MYALILNWDLSQKHREIFAQLRKYIADESCERYENKKGLVQKVWYSNEETGQFGGIYLWEQASTIFLDPRMISIFDTGHSEYEDRWATIGIDRNGVLLVVVHTFQQVEAESCRIRIISARKATRKESKQYQEGNK